MKRIAIAVFIGIICFYGIVFAEPVEVVPLQNKILGSYSGRFVFGQIFGLGRDQYMLDTQTGRLWQLIEIKDKSTLLQINPISSSKWRFISSFRRFRKCSCVSIDAT